MKITKTDFKDLIIINPQIFEDARGYFFESYNKQKLHEAIGNIEFVQDNQSKSVKGTIRGLHYQLAPYAQSKLIRVLDGTIYDVVVEWPVVYSASTILFQNRPAEMFSC